MTTNLKIDDKLTLQAQKIGRLKTKEDTVNFALKEFISKRRQEEIIELFGTIEYKAKYNYKKLRNRTNAGRDKKNPRETN